MRTEDAGRRKENKVVVIAMVIAKDVRQLVTAERHLQPKCTNFGFFTTKMYEFWFFYY